MKIIIIVIYIYLSQINLSQEDLVYLPSFTSDFKEIEDKRNLLDHGTLLDSMIMERLNIPGTDVLGYLIESYLRAIDEQQKTWNKLEYNQKLINYAIELTINFCHLYLTTPECFSEAEIPYNIAQEQDGIYSKKVNRRTALNLTRIFEKNGFDQKLYQLIIVKFDEDERKAIVKDLILQYRDAQRKGILFETKAQNNIDMFKALINTPEAKKIIFDINQSPWVPGPGGISLKGGVGSCTGDNLENHSLLGIILKVKFISKSVKIQGPFLSLHFIPHSHALDSVSEQDQVLVEKINSEFENINRRSLRENHQKYLQGIYRNYNSTLTDIFKLLLKKSEEAPNSQEEMLRWFSACIIGNTSRGKLGSRLEKVSSKMGQQSSDPFCLNIFDSMLEISKIFLKRDDPKLDKINPSYLQKSKRLQLSESPFYTKQINNVKQIKLNSDFGTITEFYFMAICLFHYGFISITQNHTEIINTYQELDQRLKEIEENNLLFKRVKDSLDKLKKLNVCYHITLNDDYRLKQIWDLCDVTISLILKWAEIDPHKIKECNLPGYTINDIAFYLPEYLITDIYEFYFYFCKYYEDYLTQLPKSYIDNILTFTCVLLSNIDLVSNPYTVAKFVELLYVFDIVEPSIMSDIYKFNEVAKNNLTCGLVQFYVNIEFTGDSHQFYSKFQYRHQVSNIFKLIWKIKDYKEALINITDTPIFERFINLHMNDTNYSLDEGFLKFDKLLEIVNKKEFKGSITEEEEKQLAELERHVNILMLQANESVSLMKNLCDWAPQTFLQRDYTKRFVFMLNFFASQLINPKFQKLKTKQAEKKYNFKPNQLLQNIIKIYKNLSFNEEFLMYITQDERSYSAELMENLVKWAQNSNEIDQDTYDGFLRMTQQLASISLENKDLANKLGDDIPEEFQCLITCDLMRDPVELPTSGNIVDKSSIKQILLNDEHDPFNRAPLKLSQVKELPELKKKIEKWIQDKLAAYDLKHGLSVSKKGNQTKGDEPNNKAQEEEKMEVEDDNSFGIPLTKRKF